MSLCVLCGQQNPDESLLCAVHVSSDEAWAASNRLMCDFLHRGIVPPRLDAEEPADLAFLLSDEATEPVLELARP